MGKDKCKDLALFSAVTSTIDLSQSGQTDNMRKKCLVQSVDLRQEKHREDTGVPGNSAALFFSEQCLPLS